MVGEACAGILQNLDAGEEALAQRLVRAQVLHQHFIALRHVEIERRGDVEQVMNRLVDPDRGGCAIVDIERAAVEEGDAEIVVAAGGVVPGQPVDQNRRLVLQEGQRVADHDLVGRDHALRVDHRLRLAGGAGGKQELGNRFRAEIGDGDIDCLRRRLRQDLAEIMRAGTVERSPVPKTGMLSSTTARIASS